MLSGQGEGDGPEGAGGGEPSAQGAPERPGESAGAISAGGSAGREYSRARSTTTSPSAEPEQATIRVEHQIGEEGDTDSVTFGEETDAEMTVSVSYHASSVAHGLVQAWVTADGDEIDRQIVEFEDEYPGGPERPEDHGNRAVVTYFCDAAH